MIFAMSGSLLYKPALLGEAHGKTIYKSATTRRSDGAHTQICMTTSLRQKLKALSALGCKFEGALSCHEPPVLQVLYGYINCAWQWVWRPVMPQVISARAYHRGGRTICLQISCPMSKEICITVQELGPLGLCRATTGRVNRTDHHPYAISRRRGLYTPAPVRWPEPRNALRRACEMIPRRQLHKMPWDTFGCIHIVRSMSLRIEDRKTQTKHRNPIITICDSKKYQIIRKLTHITENTRWFKKWLHELCSPVLS